MNDQELIAKIQLLKDIKPTQEWVLSCRGRLAFRLEMDRKKDFLKKDIFALRELFAFWGNTRQPSFSLVHSFIIALIVVIGGGGLTVWAAAQSLPGSPLYPVKLAIEKARVSASFSDESRLQLQAQLADTRVQELTAVIHSQDNTELKAEKVSQVVESIQDQIATVNNQLSKRGDKPEPQKALAAAKIVSEKANQAGKALAEAKEGLSGDIKPDLTVKLADATEAADKANMAALEAMVANSAGQTATTTEEIAAKLGEEISKIRKQISAKETKIADIGSFADKLPIRAVLINQFAQSLDLLDKAEEALEKGDLGGALEMLKAAKAINSGTDKMTQDSGILDAKEQIKGAASSTIIDRAK